MKKSISEPIALPRHKDGFPDFGPLTKRMTKVIYEYEMPPGMEVDVAADLLMSFFAQYGLKDVLLGKVVKKKRFRDDLEPEEKAALYFESALKWRKS